jgi:serine/threonine protein kinase
VLEYVPAGSLADLLDGSPQLPDAAALVECLARAVHHAHRKNILHRDLKPANILLQDLTTEAQRRRGDKDLAFCKHRFLCGLSPFGIVHRRPKCASTRSRFQKGLTLYSMAQANVLRRVSLGVARQASLMVVVCACAQS